MSSASAPAPRLRKTRAESRDETRNRLITSAIELFAVHGVSAISLQAIAEHAGYSRGAVHGNFADRDAILEAVVQVIIADVAPELDAALSGADTSLEQLSRYIRAYVRFCAQRPASAQAMIAIAGYRNLATHGSYAASAENSLDELIQVFRRGQSTGELRAFDPSMMALNVRSALDAHSHRFSTSKTDWEHVAAELSTTFQFAIQKEQS